MLMSSINWRCHSNEEMVFWIVWPLLVFLSHRCVCVLDHTAMGSFKRPKVLIRDVKTDYCICPHVVHFFISCTSPLPFPRLGNFAEIVLLDNSMDI